MTRFQKRRALTLWGPAMVVGCILCLIGAPLTTTLNGLGLLGLLVGYGGVLLAAVDDWAVTTGRLP